MTERSNCHTTATSQSPRQGPHVEATCPRCKGSGDVQAMTQQHGPDDYEATIECPECKGTGVLPNAVAAASSAVAVPGESAKRVLEALAANRCYGCGWPLGSCEPFNCAMRYREDTQHLAEREGWHKRVHEMADVLKSVRSETTAPSETPGVQEICAMQDALRSSVATTSTLADELETLDAKATAAPWSSKILRDYHGASGSNDTSYVYGPEAHPKVFMGLWPIHPPEETAAVEQRMFNTLELVCTLRNRLPEIIAALRAPRSATTATNEGKKHG